MSELKPLVLTIQQTADALSVHRNVIYRMVRDGQLRTVTIGRRKRVVRADLERWMLEGGEAPR